MPGHPLLIVKRTLLITSLITRFNSLLNMGKFKVVPKDDSDKLMIKVNSILYRGLTINMDYFMEQSDYYKIG